MTTPTNPSLLLASYNIRAGLGTDLRRDPARVLEAIARMGADVVVLQEADHRMGVRPAALPRDMIERITGLTPLPVARALPSLGWHGIALLARPAVTLTDLHRVDLPGLEPRGAVIADLGGAFGPLRLVGVHLGLLRSSRRAQLSAIREKLAVLHDAPTIVAGDFNEWSRRRGLGRLSRDFQIVTPHRTFPSRRPLAALDRLAHSPDLRVDLLPPPIDSHPHPSDHLPVLARLTREP